MARTPLPGVPKAPTSPTLVALLTQKSSSLSLYFPCLGCLLLSSRGDYPPGHPKHQLQIKNRKFPWRLVTPLRPTCLWLAVLGVKVGLFAPAASEMQLPVLSVKWDRGRVWVLLNSLFPTLKLGCLQMELTSLTRCQFLPFSLPCSMGPSFLPCLQPKPRLEAQRMGRLRLCGFMESSSPRWC